MLSSTPIHEAFVTKFAASGHILHLQGPMRLLEDGCLDAGKGQFYRPKHWCRTLAEAQEAYRVAVEYTIRSRLKQIDELKKRLNKPKIDLRVVK